jgi:outer membrane protein TolC
VLSSRELVLVYTQAVSAAQEQAAEAERRRTAGETGIQDLEQARARLMQSQAMLVEAKATLDISNQEFRHIAGPKAFVPDGVSIADVKAIQKAVISESQLSDAIDKQNPEIRSARYQEDAARFERDKAKADYFPTLEAYVSASRGDNDTNTSIKDEQRIGLQLSMPLYTHGAISSAVAQADANFRRAQAQTQSAVLRIRLEAISAQSLVRVLETRMVSADRSAEAARLSLRAAQQGVKAGVSSRSEVAQALQDFLGAQRQRVTVRKDYMVAWLRLQKALAELEESKMPAYEQMFKVVTKP